MKSIDFGLEIETNMIQTWKLWFASDIDHLKYEDRPNYFKFTTNIKYPLANGIFNAKVTPELVPKLIKSFKVENLPFIWLITPSSRPVDLKNILVLNGLNLISQSTGMAMQISKLKISESTSENLEIVKVDTLEVLNEWVKVALIGNGYPLGLIQDFFIDALSPKIFKKKLEISAFLGYYNNEPVASSFVYYSGGVVGIYWVATLERARKKGFGTAMTLAVFQEAKKIGYNIVILQSSEMAINMYEGIGFQKYNNFQIFGWIPEFFY